MDTEPLNSGTDDELLAFFDRQLRERALPDGPGARIERSGDVVRQVGPAPVWNGVLWSDLTAATAEVQIAEQVRHFASLGVECEWKLYAHDCPADLGQRLVAAGFEAEPDETVMVARVADLARDPDPAPGISLHPVTDAAGVDLLAEVHEGAFGGDASRLRERLLAQLAAAPDTLVAVVAMAGDVPVSAARMEFYPGTDFAGLWGGGTLPGWRGKGIYRALIAHRARIAAERGCRYLQVDASDQSRPILQRLGFVPLTVTTPYIRRP
ncbi:GNAT family N-acetyltransferase [Streptomyces sp. NBC_00083]|uniref:GNAT family N-acetyltransferase n=1 Tax=Streptomyces sp. NBC_00083 TaxID=2975647 RepID=UPI00224D486D|nr:GNAT family N-acetyltransferase [Streptomyces sp. NBC_00083]MCX5383722.1 GNAT family N-acetyltransferase [Streptomyces sp. NBC_00083]